VEVKDRTNDGVILATWRTLEGPVPHASFAARAWSLESMSTFRESAQGLVEYGLIIALVAVLAIAGLIIFGPAVSALLSRLGGSG